MLFLFITPVKSNCAGINGQLVSDSEITAFVSFQSCTSKYILSAVKILIFGILRACIGVIPFGLIALQIILIRKRIFTEMLEHIIEAVYDIIFYIISAATRDGKDQTQGE